MSQESSGFRFGEHRRGEACPTTTGRRHATVARDATRWLTRQTAGAAALILALFAGVGVGQQTWIQTAETGTGTAILIGQPGASFWASAGLLAAAVLFLTYATGGQP